MGHAFSAKQLADVVKVLGVDKRDMSNYSPA
jgi:hypothetical protein